MHSVCSAICISPLLLWCEDMGWYHQSWSIWDSTVMKMESTRSLIQHSLCWIHWEAGLQRLKTHSSWGWCRTATDSCIMYVVCALKRMKDKWTRIIIHYSTQLLYLLIGHWFSWNKEPTSKSSNTRYDWRQAKCNIWEGAYDKYQQSHPGLVEC